jgi:hypothetical protein
LKDAPRKVSEAKLLLFRFTLAEIIVFLWLAIFTSVLL